MFENGSYLRRRKRFKLLNDQTSSSKRTDKSTSTTRKTSFFIDEILADESNSNSFEPVSYNLNYPICIRRIDHWKQELNETNWRDLDDELSLVSHCSLLPSFDFHLLQDRDEDNVRAICPDTRNFHFSKTKRTINEHVTFISVRRY